jgi:hypothetical protein
VTPARDRAILVHGQQAALQQAAANDALAARVEVAGMPSLAKLIKAAAKFGALTIIAAIISGPVDNAERSLLGWTPPPVRVVRQMSPAQMDELARQVERKFEQWERRQDSSGHHGS